MEEQKLEAVPLSTADQSGWSQPIVAGILRWMSLVELTIIDNSIESKKNKSVSKLLQTDYILSTLIHSRLEEKKSIFLLLLLCSTDLCALNYGVGPT